MFGLFYMAANAIAYAISGTKIFLEDNDAKKRAIIKKQKGENIENLYMDHRGSMRDINTNQIRHVSPDSNGDYWLTDLYGKKISNLSQRKREEEFLSEKQRNPEKKVIKYTDWTDVNSPITLETGKLTGTIYKDVYNNDLYIKRKISWNLNDNYPYRVGNEGCSAYFYMRISDGMLIYLCEDNEIYGHSIDNVDDIDINGFIAFFNQKQREGGWLNSRLRDKGNKLYGMNSKRDYYLVGRG